MSEINDSIDEIYRRYGGGTISRPTKMDELNDKIDEIKKLMEEQLEVMNKTLEAITQYNRNIMSEFDRNRDIMKNMMRGIRQDISFLM